VELRNLGGVDVFDLLEVDKRAPLLAEDTVELESLESASKRVRLWHARCCSVDFTNVRKEVR